MRQIVSASVALLVVALTFASATGDEELDEPLEYKGGGSGVEFSPDGKRLVAFGQEDGAVILDANTARPLTPRMEHGQSPKNATGKRLYSARFSPDGTKIVTTGEDEEARVWDASSGKLLLRLPLDDTGSDAEFSQDGRRIATASYDATAIVWDAENGKRLLTIQHGDAVMYARFNRDRSRLLIVGRDGIVQLCDAITGARMAELGKRYNLACGDFSSDGKWVVTGGEEWGDKTDVSFARVWDANTGAPLASATWHGLSPEVVALSPDGKWIGVAARGACVFDASTGKPVTRWLRDDFDQRTHCIAFSPDSKYLLRAGESAEAVVVDIQRARPC